MKVIYNFANITVDTYYSSDPHYLSDDDETGIPDDIDEYLTSVPKNKALNEFYVYGRYGGNKVSVTIPIDSNVCPNVAVCSPLYNYNIETYNDAPYKTVRRRSVVIHYGPIKHVTRSSQVDFTICARHDINAFVFVTNDMTIRTKPPEPPTRYGFYDNHIICSNNLVPEYEVDLETLAVCPARLEYDFKKVTKGSPIKYTTATVVADDNRHEDTIYVDYDPKYDTYTIVMKDYDYTDTVNFSNGHYILYHIPTTEYIITGVMTYELTDGYVMSFHKKDIVDNAKIYAKN